MKLFPRSLPGQLAFMLALVLLIVQGINFYLLAESQRKLEAANDDITIGRFVSLVDRGGTIENFEEMLNRRRSRFDQRQPDGEANQPGEADEENEEVFRARQFSRRRTQLTEKALAEDFDVRPAKSRRLQAALDDAGLLTDGALVAVRPYEDRRFEELNKALVFSAQYEEGKWVNYTQPIRPPPPLPYAPLLLQTLFTYFLLLAGVLAFARHITKPLSRLTDASKKIMTPESPERLQPEGPEDIRALTIAFEEMRTRIRRLFEEKDVMLGAIGHDLRTPLTSLRIRVESVPDDTLREKMIASVDELSMLLEDVLNLARNGQAEGPLEQVDIAALIDSVISDLPRDKGKIITENLPSPCVVEGYPVLLKRAVRNLVDNSLRHASESRIHIQCTDNWVEILVEDNGPGVAEADLPKIRNAFVRGEGSRNRKTGGAGLGLALVEGVANAHHGELILENRTEGGFRAVIRLPVGA